MTEPAAAPVPAPEDFPRQSATGAEPTPPRKRRRRHWPKVLLGLVLLVVLLVLMAPTIASSGPVRSFVLGKVNQNLNGRVEVASWSAGWTGGIKVQGVRVFDDKNVQILELKSLTTELKLLDAARGRLHLGKVVVDGLDANAKTDADGTLNFAKLAKQTPDTQQPPSQPSAPQPESTEPTKLPDVTGELHLVNCRATYEDGRSASIGGTGQTFYFPSIAGVVKFPDLNKAIENAIDITAKVGDQAPGKITLAGTADIAENNELQIDKAAVDQKLTLQGIELSSLSFALGKDGGIQRLAGRTDGSVVVKAVPTGDATLDVAIKSQNLTVAGPALKGGTYQTKLLDVALPNVVVNRSADPNDFTKWIVKAGTDAAPIAIKIDQGTVTLAADAPVGALQNLAANKAPGASGFARANVDLNIGDLAKQLPALFAVKEGLTITGGRLKQVTDVAFAPDRATVKTLTLDLTDVAGTDATRNNAAVQLQPIRLALNATSLGGGGAIPDLRDLKLTIQSAFANGVIEGRSIAETNGTITADLKQAREEASKVVDLGALQLGGTLAIGIGSKGDLLAESVASRRADVGLSVHGQNLVVAGIEGQPPVNEPEFKLDFTATVHGDEQAFVGRAENVRLTLAAGEPARPTVAAEFVGSRIDLPAGDGAATRPASPAASTSPSRSVTAKGMNLKRLNVNLAQAQREFGAFVPALQAMGLDFAGGSLDVTGAGDYDGRNATYTARIALGGVNLNKTPKSAPGAQPQPARPVLADYTATIDAAGKYAALPNDQAQITLGTFAVDGKMFSLGKSAGRDISITTGPAGVSPSADLTLSADLRQVNDVLAALSDGPAVQVVAANGQAAPGLRSGRIGGAIQVQPFENDQFKITTRDLKLTELTVAGESGAAALNSESLAIDVQARPQSDFSAITVDRMAVDGKLANVSVEKAQVVLTIGKGDAARPATVPEMVQTAAVKVTVPNLGQVQALLDALSPPAAAGARALAVPLAEAVAQAGPVDPNAVISRPADRGAVRAGPEAAKPAPAAPGAADAPAPPTRFEGGSLVLNLNVARQGERTVITQDAVGKDVTLAKGPARDTIADLSVATQVSYVPVAPPKAVVTKATTPAGAAPAATAPVEPSVLELMRDLQIPKLDANVVRAGAKTPVVRLALSEPLSISRPAALSSLFASLGDPKAAPQGEVPTLRTGLKGSGDLGELMALLKVLSADPSPERPYAGTYTLDQKVTAGKEGLAAAGSIDVADLSVKGPNSDFSEKALRVANDVSLDAAKQVLSIRNVSLAMEATKALELALKGNVREFDTTRTLDGVSGTIGYDWAKVWQIVEPMLDAETRKSLKLTLAGKGSKPFSLSGSYPADKPFNEAVRTLAGSFELAFDQLNYNEIDTRNLVLPITLKGGIATIAFADKPAGSNFPPPAPCNGGFISLGGANVDLTGDLLRLNIPKGTKLLDNVALNPYFSDTLGDYINNPAFVSPSTASGTVTVTIEQCDKFPLASLDTATAKSDPGRLVAVMSMTKLQLGNPMIVGVLEQVAKFGGADFAEGSLQGEIKEARVVMEKGTVQQDVTIATGEKGRELRIAGGANLVTSQLQGMNFYIGPQFLSQWSDDLARALPEGLPIALSGTTRTPHWDPQRSITAAVGNNFKDPKSLGDFLGNVLGGNKNKKQPTTPGAGAAANPGGKPAADPAMKDPKDPVGGLLDDLLGGGDKKETDKEKEERRAKRRKERELEQQRLEEERKKGGSPQGGEVIGKPAEDPKKKRK